MDPIAISFICIGLMVVLMLLGMNIGLAMLVSGFAGYAWVVNVNGALSQLSTLPYTSVSTYSFSVIALFTLMGVFAYYSGLGTGLYNATSKWLGGIPGGLGMGTIAACTAFGAICGSGPATCATIGKVALPEMRAHGYSDKLTCGTVAASAGLGIMIPPSTVFILYGIATNISIGKLFISGIIPGIITAGVMMLTTYVMVKKDPSLAPNVARCTWKEKFVSLKGVIAIVILFAIVIVGMFIGIFTSNEAAGIGAVSAFAFMVINKQCSFKRLKECLLDAVKTFSMVYLTLIGAQMFGYFLAVSRLPTYLAQFVSSLDTSKYVVIAIIILIYAFLGCIMDGAAMVLLTVPIFYPIVTELGFNGIWFGVIIVLVSMIGSITPPVGLSVYVMGGVAKDVPLPTIFRGALPYLISLLIAAAILIAFPSLATWLPGLMRT